MTSNPTSEKKAPLRDVLHDSIKRRDGYQHDFRVLTLSCGHHVFRQPAQKVQLRARCWECAV